MPISSLFFVSLLSLNSLVYKQTYNIHINTHDSIHCYYYSEKTNLFNQLRIRKVRVFILPSSLMLFFSPFFSLWGNFLLNVSFKEATHPLNCMKKSLFFLSVLKDNFTVYKILGFWFFSLNA